MVLETLTRLGADKVREPDEDTRLAIFNAIQLLCTSKNSRQYMRRRRAYPIIRNADLAETAEPVKEVIFSIINFLGRDEEDGDNEDLLGAPAPEVEGSTADLPLSAPRSVTDRAEKASFVMKRDELDEDAASEMNTVD